MKWTKRMLSAVLALLMLWGLIPLSALPVLAGSGAAWDDAMELTLDAIAYSSYESNRAWFVYTPEQDGDYVFCSQGEEGLDPIVYVYEDPDDAFIASDDDGGSDYNFSCGVALSAGITYYFCVEELNGEDIWTLPVIISKTNIRPDAIEMELDDGYGVDIYDAFVYEWYCFTAQTSGYYAFSSYDYEVEADPKATLFNYEMEEIKTVDDNGENSNFRIEYFMELGETVYLKAYAWNDCTGQYAIKVEKMLAPTGMHFVEGDSFAVFIDEPFSPAIAFTPEGAYSERVTWQSSDESILQAVQDADYLMAVAPGTATVTATSESGLTATCEVTVNVPAQLELDSPCDFSLAQNQQTIFAFTPTQDGWHNFVICGEEGEYPNLNCSLYSGDNWPDTYENWQDENQVIQANLTAGVTYRLRMNRNTDVTQSAFSVSVTKAPELTGIRLRRTSDSAIHVGRYYSLTCEVLPSGAPVGRIEYTSSNEDVVEIDGINNVGCEFYTVSIGTATITATSPEGFTDTITITVEDYPEIKTDETVPVTLEEEDTYLAKFVPQASGYYDFTFTNSKGEYSSALCDANFETLDCDGGYDEEGNYRLRIHLDSDETYYLKVESYSSYDVSFDLMVSKLPQATKIEIKGGTTASAYQGGTDTYEVVFTPTNAMPEDVVWTTSNKNVVEVQDTYGNGSVNVYYKGAGKATLTATTQVTNLKATVTITVTAATTAALNTVKIGTITKARKNYSFKYTPSASGNYVARIAAENPDYVMVGVASSADGPLGGGFYGENSMHLTAKTTYYFSVRFAEDMAGDFTFLLQKNKAVTGLKLSQTDYVGEVGQRFSLWDNYVTAIPTMERLYDVDWSVADEDVAYIDEDGELVLNAIGTTTLTAAAEGKTVTAKVTVKDRVITPYTIGDETTVNYIQNAEYYWYSVAVAEDGQYVFSSFGTNGVDPVITLYDSQGYELDWNDDGGEGVHFKMITELAVGQYYIRIHHYNGGSFPAYQWSAKKAEKATAIEITGGDFFLYVDEWRELDVSFLPGNAASEPYKLSVTGDALRLDGTAIYAFEPGTATITVTTESGLTDSITVTVKTREEMALSERYPLEFSTSNSFYKTFTPDTSGVYNFILDAAEAYYFDGYIMADEDVEQTTYSPDDEGTGLFMVQARLTAGKTYTLHLYQQSEEADPTGATVYVTKPEQKGLPTIQTETTKPQGGTEYLEYSQVVMDPNLVYGEILGWATSDPRIATVNQEGFVRYLRVGKVTLTAQTAYGDVSVTVSVQAATAMTLNKEYAVKNSTKEVYHKFAPTKDGYYTFTLKGTGLFDLFDPQGNYLEVEMSDDSGLQQTAYLVTGQTYYVSSGPRMGGPGFEGVSYTVKVTSGSAPKDTKGVFSLSDDAEDAYVPDGEKAVVRVKVRGEGLTYKWYYANKGSNTFAASSITKDTYSVTIDSTRDGRRLYCLVTDKYGNMKTSRVVTIGIKKPLKITTQPTNAVAENGSSIKASFVASGDDLTYTWYYKDAGATDFAVTNTFKSNSYTTTMTDARAGRQVFCVVNDKYGNAVKTATVTLYQGSPVKIITQPKGVQVKNGATAKVTFAAAGDGLTYTWYVKNSGSTKYVKSSLTTSSYSCKMSSTTRNRTVYCVVTDQYGMTAKTNAVIMRMAASITTQPKSVKVKNGTTAKVTVKAAGDGLKYTWYVKNPGAKKFTKSSIKTSSYTFKMTTKLSGRQVYCVVSDKYGKSVQTNTVSMKKK